LIYPVGIVITLGVATNPATLLGIGTWTAITGKVIVGKAGSGTFTTLNGTGGAETHTLSVPELAGHTHSYLAGGAATGRTGDPGTDRQERDFKAYTTGSTGSGTAHNNLQPYIVKFVWQRVS